MRSEALIEALCRDATPIAPRAIERRLAVGLAVGGGFALLLVTAALGPRPDLAAVADSAAFWEKAAYALGMGVTAILLVNQLARPDSDRLRRPWLTLIPIAGILLLATIELMQAASTDRIRLFLNPTWACIPLILMLAIPIFTGLVWALRQMAPTRLEAAGAAAGIAAGSFAAMLYCLHCQQASSVFVVTRYTAAMALASLAGALLGPRLLRW
jgi:hypothetical protein